MKILLTAANGQLGRALQMVLKHHHVVALAHDQIDITQLDQVLGFVAWLGMPSVWLSHHLFPAP